MTLESLHPTKTLRSLPDDELMRRLTELACRSRRVEADLIAHIGEVEKRRLYARLAFPSMHAYCTRALHLSEAEAYRRITVARAARRYSGLLEMLRDGSLHLTGMALIVPLLTAENREAVPASATHRSKREIQKLVAELAPKPDVPTVVRKLPQKRTALAATPAQERRPIARPDLVSETGGGRLPSPVTAPPPRLSSGAHPELFPETVELVRPIVPPVQPSRPAVVEPLSPSRYKVQFTASQELHDKLERLTALMRSQVPDGDLAAIIDEAVSEKLERLEAKRFGKTPTPRKTLSETDAKPRSGSRQIPAAVRRAISERDEGRCRFVDREGRRCSEQHRVEFHHEYPFGLGINHSPGNIRLLCHAHNRLMAEVDFGGAAPPSEPGAARVAR